MCKTFTNPTRLRILNLLRSGERTVGDLAGALGIAQPTVSQHLTVLRSKGTLLLRKEGPNVYYRVANPKILQACDLMREVLQEHLEAANRMAQGVR